MKDPPGAGSLSEAPRLRNLVTLDRSWFYYYTDHQSIRLSGKEKTPEKEWKIIASPIMMLIVVWNPAGFHVAHVLAKCVKFCSPRHLSDIIDPLLFAH
jgi:hypothetical protein